MPNSPPFPELVRRARDLLDAPGQAREDALALAIEHALDHGPSNAIGHAVLQAAAKGKPGLAEKLASRVIHHSSRWILPGPSGEPVSLTAIAVPLLVAYQQLPTFTTTSAVTAFEASFSGSGLFPSTSRVTLVPYLYTLDELLEIGFCHAEEIAFALAAKAGGVLPPREQFSDYHMTGGATPDLGDGRRLHWLLGIVADAVTAPPPWLLLTSDPEASLSDARAQASLAPLSRELVVWQESGRAQRMFGQDVAYSLGLPCLLTAAAPRIALSTGLLALEAQMSLIDPGTWPALRSDISWTTQEALDPQSGDSDLVDVLSVALQGPLSTVAHAEFMLSPFLRGGAVDTLFGCILEGRGHSALYARTRRFSLDTRVAPLGSLLN